MDPDLLRVNHDGVLSVPVSMWWCFVFLLRHSILLAVTLVSTVAGTNSASWAYGLVSWPAVLSELPMWLLLYALARRTSSGETLPRWLWQHGREIMSLTALSGVGLATWYLSGQDQWRPWPERMIVVAAMIDIAIIIGCWRSVVYKQVFAEFPPK